MQYLEIPVGLEIGRQVEVKDPSVVAKVRQLSTTERSRVQEEKAQLDVCKALACLSHLVSYHAPLCSPFSNCVHLLSVPGNHQVHSHLGQGWPLLTISLYTRNSPVPRGLPDHPYVVPDAHLSSVSLLRSSWRSSLPEIN